VECSDNYFVDGDTCTQCDVSCELKCTGAGPKACTDNKCKAIGYYADAVNGCVPCETVLANCLTCTKT
jgi:hypothetical protein